MKPMVTKTKRKPSGAAAMGPGPGRPKGSQNKMTSDLKQMILTALEGAGGVAYLQEQAIENPKAFLPLLGKVLPLQVTGEDGGALVVKVIRLSGEAADGN